MERIHTLISKLQTQLAQNLSKEQLLYTAQLLVAELSSEPIISENKVSVLMPTCFVASSNENIVRVEIEELKAVEKIEEVLKNDEANEIELTEVAEEKNIEQKVEKIIEEIKPVEKVVEQKPIINDENKVVYELNDLAQNESLNINDKLKETKVEVVHTLVDAPVKDLRKAIGINDKYLFINELFSHDEAMYERSIKTINNFGTYREAEQWINRELYTKLCWLKDNTVVETFYTLVKRRFAEM